MYNKKPFHAGLLIIIALVGAGVFLTRESDNEQPDIGWLPSKVEIVQKVSPSVVTIVVTKDLPLYETNNNDFNFDPFFNLPFSKYDYDRKRGANDLAPSKIAVGSGFIIDKTGLILTTAHVVSDSDADFTVILENGAQHPAEVTQLDSQNDIALLKIVSTADFPELPTATLRSSSNLKIGQEVIAIGGNGRNVVGEIGKMGRTITAGTIKNPVELRNLLEIVAPITSGYSGGPLIDLNGDVIGIIVALSSGEESIGFAIPIDDVKPFLEGKLILKEAD